MKNIIIKTSVAALAFMTSMAAFAAQTPAGTYSLDKAHTNIGFSVTHMGISNTVGRFNKFDGSVQFEPNGTSKVDFTVDVDTVDTNNRRRDDHLRSDDFFDVENFPEISFKSSEVTYDENGDPKEIKGALDLHGETQTVTFNVSTVGAGTSQSQAGTTLRAGYLAKAVIDRTDFGMDNFLLAAGKEVTITVNIEITKPE